METRTPYHIKVIDDFLPEKNYKSMLKLYSQQQFFTVKSDLFSFLQSKEILSSPEFSDFLERIDDVFLKNFKVEKNHHYNGFASYYRTGDYLLCHDDCSEQRRYAFTYYLNDFRNGGELIIYENNCMDVYEKIGVKKNRIVIFEVSPKSYHEVDICTGDGRCAITGWLSESSCEPHSDISNQLPDSIPEPIIYVDLGKEFQDAVLKIKLSRKETNLENKRNKVPKTVKKYTQGKQLLLENHDDTQNKKNRINCLANDELFNGFRIEYKDIEFPVLKKTRKGPYTNRRFDSIYIEKYYVPMIKGYEIVYYQYGEFKPGNYILINDKVNAFKYEDIIDIFIFDGDEEIDNFITFVGIDQTTLTNLSFIPGTMYVMDRMKQSFVINRLIKHGKLKHLIYRRAG